MSKKTIRGACLAVTVILWVIGIFTQAYLECFLAMVVIFLAAKLAGALSGWPFDWIWRKDA